MPEPDDDAFYDALAGRAHAPLTPEVQQQALALRKAVIVVDGDFESTEAQHRQHLERLLFRLQRENLLPAARARWTWPMAAAAAAATVVGLVVVWPLWQSGEGTEPPMMRGQPAPQQVIEVDDVAAMSQAVAAALVRAGVAAQEYPLGIHRGLNASVVADKRAAAARELSPLGVRLPDDGELRLEIRERQGTKK
jgi:hypothetical protein